MSASRSFVSDDSRSEATTRSRRSECIASWYVSKDVLASAGSLAEDDRHQNEEVAVRSKLGNNVEPSEAGSNQ